MVAEKKKISLGAVEAGYVLNRLDAVANEANKSGINLRAVPTDGECYVEKVCWYDFLDSKCKWGASEWLSRDYTLPNQVVNAFSNLININKQFKMLPVRLLVNSNVNIKFQNNTDDIQFAQTFTGRYVLIRFDKSSKTINIYFTAGDKGLERREIDDMHDLTKLRYGNKAT